MSELKKVVHFYVSSSMVMMMVIVDGGSGSDYDHYKDDENENCGR